MAETGRPTDYCLETVFRICERLVEGESLRAICRDPEMPGIATVFRWLHAHETFREQYAHARECQADTFADELTEIADDGRNDWMQANGGEDAGWKANGENVQRARLRVDTRKWIASKLKPKKYGDKIETTHQGPGGGPIVISSTDAEL